MPVGKKNDQLDANHLEDGLVRCEIFFELVVDLMYTIHGNKNGKGVDYGCPCRCVSWVEISLAKLTERLRDDGYDGHDGSKNNILENANIVDL